MSKHSRGKKGLGRTQIVAIGIGIVILASATGMLLYLGSDSPVGADDDSTRAAALASEKAPSQGPLSAKVHIVEFLDPACETCAVFFPLVKQWMAEMPDDIRLSVRHVAFHEGADYAVRVLEASRAQGKYWQTLETLLATQDVWVRHHVVQPQMIAPVLRELGLDMERLRVDMNSVAVRERAEQDKQDSILLKVSATPEYFVNGRPLPSFGQRQLAQLIREELDK